MFPTFFIVGTMAVIAFRLLLLPIRLIFKFVIHGLCGFVCLMLVNTVSVITGIAIAVNLITVLIAGFLGVPGILLLAALEMIA